MEITITSHGAIRVLVITGSVDSFSADELARRFADLAAQGNARLVADFSLVDYTSSAGLRSLLGAVKHCRGAGGDLRMAAPQPQVRRVLEIAGFADIIQIFPDARLALESYAEDAA
jgi:anti-sigma B factor antagonist